MSGFLPMVQDKLIPHEEEVSETAPEQQEDLDSPRSSGSSESGDTPLLHTSATLKYPDSNQPSVAGENGMEMATFADSSAQTSQTEGTEASGAQAHAAGEPETCSPGGDRAADNPGPEEEGGPAGTVPTVFNPTVRVVGPRCATPSEDGTREEGLWLDAEKPVGNGSDLDRQPFLAAHCRSQGDWLAPRSYALPDAEWPESNGEARGQKRPCCASCTRPNLKATAAMAAALIIYPCFLYGAYVFLPFDVPLMPDLTVRMIYTLRCSVFATVPIIMGIIVYGLARCCSASLEPFAPRKEEVEIHLRFVTDSVHLFVLFLINLIVLSTYIPQEVLKLLPLLTAFFALARLIYWLTFAISSTFRGFGYGLTFFPVLGLLVCNLCYMFILAPDKMFATSASETEGQEKASGPRQRFWG
ncbi:transmembrane protein 79-like [Heterodontus francisci]|uniref:transmembrane protein 79-like n=1 Tax=Heterodontus francisci TaxID=7792 RepID=UPI00355BE3CD